MVPSQPEWLEKVRAEDAELEAFVHFAGDPPAAPPAIRLGVKDIIDVAGLPTECGTPICRGAVTTVTAPCVAALERAGATVIGKTVTTEYATTRPGPTRNPLNPNHSPGGSSSGSAAAVSSGALDWALGTQTAGSVIRPAAFCGIVGFLPSAGIVPRVGVRIMSPTLDRVGVFARRVADAETMMRAFPDHAPMPPPSGQLRIAVLPAPLWSSVDAGTRRMMERAIEAIAAQGDTIVPLEDPAPFEAMLAAQKIVMGYEIPRSLVWELDTHADLLSNELRAFCAESAPISRSEYATALDVADCFRLLMGRLFQDCDAILGPAAAQLAPEGLGWTGDPFVNRIWSLAKFPAVAIPGAAAVSGLKSSLQFNAPAGQDSRLLAIAGRYEALAAGIRPD